MSSDLIAVAFGLASAVVWGSGDFFGGMATKRISAQRVVFWAQIVGALLMLVLVVVRGEKFSSPSDYVWSCIAGLFGVVGLLALYRALATGKMGVVAPITAIVSAVLPVVFGALTLGAPATLTLVGFAVAVIAVALIAYQRSNPSQAKLPNNYGLSVLSGIGFGAFFICISQVRSETVFLPILFARVASLSAFTVLNLAVPNQRANFAPPHSRGLFALTAGNGIADALGNVLFVIASQLGRLDIAAVMSSLYPASTVLLATIFLHERLTRTHTVGVILALVAVMLIAAK
jgi:uncharacterized membrane protein